MERGVFATFLFATACWMVGNTASSRSPLLIVPGFEGSQIEARVNETIPGCKDIVYGEWFRLWVDFGTLTKMDQDCFVEILRLHFDKNTEKYFNTPGVETRVPGFGNTTTIEYNDPQNKDHPGSSYFHTFVEYFVKAGYKRGLDIRAAPYDWRYSPISLTEMGYFDALYDIIEDMYQKSGKTPVTLVAHSLGAPISLYFLTTYSESKWKAERIHQFISISSAWAGTPTALLRLASGSNRQGIYPIDSTVFRIAQRSFQNAAWTAPLASNVFTREDILLSQPNMNYTAYDYEKLFADLNYTFGWEMYLQVRDVVFGELLPPGVQTACFYGSNVSTVKKLVYAQGTFPDSMPTQESGDGDGRVPLKSLELCTQWKKQQSQNVTVKAFPGVTHYSALEEEEVLGTIEKLVLSSSFSYSLPLFLPVTTCFLNFLLVL